MTSAPLALRLLSLYPKKLGSALVGVGARATLPVGMRRKLLGDFAARYGANVDEAEKPLEAYTSFLDFFTRRLKPGSRPQAALGPGAINSPVDAVVIAEGTIEGETLMQAKGLPYRIDELLDRDRYTERFVGGRYLTLYLAPKDYHRIHVPFQGRCLAVGRVEGELWPVNEASTAFTPRLYVRNRRAYWIAEGRGSAEGLWVAAVMVAATHVGGVVLAPRWLSERALPARGRLNVPMLTAEPGDDLATFELGSTVVLAIGGPRAREWTPCRPLGPVKVGERLGAF